MGTEPGAPGDAAQPQSDSWKALSSAIETLLAQREYGRLARLLESRPGLGAGDAARVDARLLAAARQLCEACLECRAQIEQGERLRVTAVARENRLRESLRAVLGMSGEGGETAVGAPDEPESEHRPRWWRRARELLGLESEMVEGETAVVPDPPRPEKPHDPEAHYLRTVATRAETPRDPFHAQMVATRTAVQTGISPAQKKDMTPRKPDVALDMSETSLGMQREHTLVVYCLGAFRVYQEDRLISDWNGLKGLSIFKYMIAQRGRPVARDKLMEVVWPDAEPEAMRRNLHQAIYSLRRVLQRDSPDIQYILFENNHYVLNHEITIWADFMEFEQHIQTGRWYDAAGQIPEAISAYSVAESLYQGDFLAEDRYEEWPLSLRRQLRHLYLEIADQLSFYHAGRGEYTAALALCQKILEYDNCYEEAHRRLMQCYLAQGQRYLALRQYQVCVHVLAEELDLAPSTETESLYQKISRE